MKLLPMIALGPLAWTIGWQEIVIVLVVLLILFGGSQLPKLARRMGRGVHEFKQGVSGAKDAFEEGMSEEDDRPQATADAEAEEPTPQAASSETDDQQKA